MGMFFIDGTSLSRVIAKAAESEAAACGNLKEVPRRTICHEIATSSALRPPPRNDRDNQPHIPNSRMAFSRVARQISSTGRPRSSAIFSAILMTMVESLRRPRKGSGAM